MDLGSILLGVALLIVVLIYVGRPFVQGHVSRRETMTEREGLEAQKAALLEQIRILDFEHETGKVPDDEHGKQRARLMQQATAILKELDDLAPALASNGSAARIESEIEAAVAGIRGGQDGPVRAPKQGDGRFCSQCGNPRDARDKFCAYCGFSFA